MNYNYPYMGNYNPINPYMQQPIQQPQAQQPTTQGAAFACRPVTSREEAIAAQTDYFGPGTVMPDIGHGVIYLKRFNPNTGASDFAEYRIVQAEEPKSEFVTRKEFDEFINRMKAKDKQAEVENE